jgi:hypothetical protein
MSGVISYFDPADNDYEAWSRECIEIDQELVDQKILEGMIIDTTHRVNDLESWGVKFQKLNGKLL